MFNDPSGADIQYIEAMFKCSYPQFISIHKHAMDVSIGNAATNACGLVVSECACGSVKPVQSGILRTDPKVSRPVLVNFPCYMPADRVLPAFGKQFFKEIKLLWKII